MRQSEVDKERATATSSMTEMKTLLICHEGAPLDREGLSYWLASFSQLVGVVVLRESGERKRRRIRREMKRVGALRFIDVLAFRLYSKMFLAREDRRWQEREVANLRRIYPHATDVPVLVTPSPNSPEAEQFIKEQRPDIMIARCKSLLKEDIFSIPSAGTFVMHPGVCPEYRNAHGCFWALVNDDLEKVGMTLLRIDPGVDTGPVYGYYSYQFDEIKETPNVIQHRVVTENLDELAGKLTEIYTGRAAPLSTNGRKSAMWGQPWLSSYLKWKHRAKRRTR